MRNFFKHEPYWMLFLYSGGAAIIIMIMMIFTPIAVRLISMIKNFFN